MKSSVCTTVYNEADNVREFLTSLLSQSLPPDEIIIVDGGSTDGTFDLQIANEHGCIRLIQDPTCNLKYIPSPIAHGRNIAIEKAQGQIIAVTDAGCRVNPLWLEEIVRPFQDIDPSIEVVGGWYEPWVETPFERCAATVSFTVTKRAIAQNRFPSRSIAFRKSLWERVHGYPELSYAAEDSLFNERWKQSGASSSSRTGL